MKNKIIEAQYPVSFCEQLNWQKQGLETMLKWHDGLKHFQTDREREAYKAAYAQGWGECFNTLKLHGNIEYKEVNE